MDLLMVGAVALLVGWLALVLTTDAPGWVHLMLTAGMFLLIWRIVARGTPSGPASANSTRETSEGNKRK